MLDAMFPYAFVRTDFVSPLGAAACVTVGAIACIAYAFASRKPYPPGPRPLPLLGNIIDLLSLGEGDPWEKLMVWREKYGDVVHLHAFGTNIIILNSMKAFKELLDKRGNNYSHRPIFTVVCKLMDMGKSMPLRALDKEWREMRKVSHAALAPVPVKQYYQMQEDMAALFAKEVLDDPKHYRDALRINASRFILAITYGLNVHDQDTVEYVNHAERTMDVVRESVVVGAYLCDFIPLMQYLPSWLPFQRRAAKGRTMVREMVNKPFEKVCKELAEGRAGPSLARDFLLEQKDNMSQDMYDRILWTSASMYAAGAESTFATILTFILAMTMNPEKQKRAQEEVDTVLGKAHLPAVEDRERLPYVDALIKEVMRWHPMLPVGFPRRSGEADVYDGFHIPGDSIIIANTNVIAFESNDVYPPEEFHPERFLDPENPATDPALWAFGFGRRMCPGKLLGENNIFIIVSTMLAAFDISPPGPNFTPPKFVTDLGSFPQPFDCRIEPRSREVEDAIRHRAMHSSL